MTFSATIPVAQMEAANAELEALGHGPCFSVPLRNGNGPATHVGFHAWDDPVFEAAVEALSVPGLRIRKDPGTVVNFEQHVTDEALEWSDPTYWFENPVMTGDQRTKGGKLWESTMDYNVWEPGVSGWREVVAEGYPAWVQPTGGHDAYAVGDKVTHDNPNDGGVIWVYQSKINANTTEPGRDGTFDRWWEPVIREASSKSGG